MTLSANVVDQATTRAELNEQATAVVPEPIARQQETEDRTYYAEDTHRVWRDLSIGHTASAVVLTTTSPRLLTQVRIDASAVEATQ
ncbi:hypothetical protein AB0M35_24090 [Micromonospora sp. NPDC051196]|uniref:hypothetical protein n=1 Tax=Micromonospora sp. NPDC051196 TaxID=3155281 RepID=UPI003439C74B